MIFLAIHAFNKPTIDLEKDQNLVLMDIIVFSVIKYLYLMAQKSQTALEKMQQIASKLISNTPELVNVLDEESALRPKRSNSPASKKTQKYPYALQASSMGKNQMTSNDYHERCRELTNELQQYRDKCFAQEEQIHIIKQRFVERQIQYRKIIEELQDELKSKASFDQKDRDRFQNIYELHKEIIDNIGSIQNKTSKILIEQESDIRRYFHKKINQIKEKFKEDKINKTEKDQEYLERQKQMISQLDWIKQIAHKIDLENRTLTKKYSTLKSEFEIQQKDKDLLMKELLMKKKQNAVLKSQVEQYEKLLNQVSREIDQTHEKGDASQEHSQDLRPPSAKSQQKSITDSRATTYKPSDRQLEKYENTITHLNNVIVKQKKKVRELKNLCMKEVGAKTDLEKILRKMLDDIRESIVENERGRIKKRMEDEIAHQTREKLLEELLTNEKILTLIYDKTFYSGNKSPQGEKLPEDLERILQNHDQEGFC